MKKRFLSIMSIILITVTLFSVVSCNKEVSVPPSVGDLDDEVNIEVVEDVVVLDSSDDAEYEAIEEEAVVIFDSTVDGETDQAFMDNDLSENYTDDEAIMASFHLL